MEYFRSMYGVSRTRLVIGAALSLLVLIGVGQGCGSGDSASSTSATTAVVTSAVTDTTAATASTTEAPTSTTAPTTTAGSATTEPSTSTTRPTGPPTLADVEDYHQWLKMNAQPIRGRTHGLTDIYIDQELQAIAPEGTLVLPFPDGTTIVKEQLEGSLVAIMRKTRGIDPEHGDWQWIEYRTDGSVAGEDASCWGCHAQAKSIDWVFTELETP